ncbi:MAG: hypothetical protein KJ698_10910 [Actinobacteria bacterium]|nr:hypothetical protein [Actinomycetota bacterium]MBU1492904.1 hypothetical protein [Actinomycetota bacterium]
MAEFDIEAFKKRFRDRAVAVRERGIPPIEGEARRMFIASAEQDFIDYSLIGDAAWSIEEGMLVLRLPLGDGEDG